MTPEDNNDSLKQPAPLAKPSQVQPKTEAYAALLRKSREIKWPHLWRSDLTKYDRARLLAPDAPQQFCWSVRETGTFLYEGHVGDLWRLLYWELHCMRASRLFRWDGQLLTERSLHETLEMVEAQEQLRQGTVFEDDKGSFSLGRLRKVAEAKRERSDGSHRVSSPK